MNYWRYQNSLAGILSMAEKYTKSNVVVSSGDRIIICNKYEIVDIVTVKETEQGWIVFDDSSLFFPIKYDVMQSHKIEIPTNFTEGNMELLSKGEGKLYDLISRLGSTQIGILSNHRYNKKQKDRENIIWDEIESYVTNATKSEWELPKFEIETCEIANTPPISLMKYGCIPQVLFIEKKYRRRRIPRK